MTATPIPRTLAMTAYADLDCSSIDELPPGRSPVQTAVISEQRRDEIVQRIRGACANGRQAYWVCPLIEESELLEAQAAEQTAEVLREALDGLSVWFFALSALLMVTCVLVSWDAIQDRPGAFYALLLLLETVFMLGVFK